MNGPTHHPTQQLLVEYASGAAPEAVALLVATHLALCPACRHNAELLDLVGGAVLEGAQQGAEPTGGLLDLDEAALDMRAARLAEPPPPRGMPSHPEWRNFPEPLRSLVPRTSRGRIDWTFNMPGLRYLDLPLAWGDIAVRISVLLGGSVFPRHGHAGLELSMVLSGGYTDRGDDYVRGDVSVAGPSLTHHLDIHRGEPCVLLVVNEQRMVPASILARILARLFPV
jgi:putative transcriptional regulator